MNNIETIEFKKGNLTNPDGDYNYPLPFHCYKILLELVEKYDDNILNDKKV